MHAVAQPQGRLARRRQGQQTLGRRIIGRDAFQQQFDARAAQKLDIGRAAPTIDQPARLGVLQHAQGMQGHVALHTAAGQKARRRTLVEQHLRAFAQGRGAFHRVQAGQDAGPVRRHGDGQGRTHVGGQAKLGPGRHGPG